MKQILFLAALALIPATLSAQDFKTNLSFTTAAAGRPAVWRGGPLETQSIDSSVFHSAPYSGRLARDANSEGQFSTFTMAVPVQFSGSTVELRGWVRTSNAVSGASLWLRQDGPTGMLSLDNMNDRVLRGTNDWRQLSIRMTLDNNASRLVFGGLLRDTGEAWFDDLEIFVDDKPYTDAPAKSSSSSTDVSKTVNPLPKIPDAKLSPPQVENVALLAKVWGFVKYHHPRVTGGLIDWDSELIRIYPSAAAAPGADAVREVLSQWLAEIGSPAECAPCAKVPTNAALTPNTSWIHDRNLLGDKLAGQLESIYANRSVRERQRYISLRHPVRNPIFDTESKAPSGGEVDAGYRILGLLRFWNIIEYWFPYRQGMAKPWESVLREAIPVFASPMTSVEYRRALMKLSAQILDTHSNLWGSLEARPPVGDAQLSALVRFVEDKPVVWGFAPAKEPVTEVLQRGDVIEKIDGAPVDSLVRAWSPYYSASNEPTRLRDIGRNLTRGPAGAVEIQVVRNGKRMTVTATRIVPSHLDNSRSFAHDLPGVAFQMLDPAVAYLKLSQVKLSEISAYLEQAKNTRVFVIDIRNYPAQFVPFALGGHFVSTETRFAKFTRADLNNPGLFEWTDGDVIRPLTPKYGGKVIVVVDETSQSQAEYTAMAFRATGAMIVGSTTAGADGNISPIPLPGGVSSMISGIGVYYPDGRPTQRVGIVPDLVVHPTIDGIRAGRDEVLEAAISKALGRHFSLRQ